MLSPISSTTSTLSVGSTGSQARLIQSSHAPSHYQPILMKDLGKKDSTDTCEMSSFKPIDNPNKNNDSHDDVCKLTEQIVDKHLTELKRKCVNYDTRDVEKFMEKLKNDEKQFTGSSSEGEIKKNDGGGGGEKVKLKDDKITGTKPKINEIKVSEVSPTDKSQQQEKKKQSTEDKQQTGDKKTPNGNVTSSNHIQVKLTRKPSLSPQGSIKKPRTIDMDAYTSSSSGDNANQVQIVKIKSSPNGSRKVSRENSRSNSAERDHSKEKQTSLKRPEGGILKKPSPKFGKASELKTPDKLRPDRFISPCSSFDSKSDKLSPSSEILPNICIVDTTRTSFSDYEGQAKENTLSVKSRSLESSLEHLKSALKPQSNYENVSPERGYDPHKYYSISAHNSIESNRSPVRYCSPNPPVGTAGHFYNEPYYEYPRNRRNQRESRSLERPAYSRQSSSEYERYYETPPDASYNRRHSGYEHRSIPMHYYSRSPDDYLAHSYENPASCADCYYQSYHHQHMHYPQQPPPLPQRNQPQLPQQQPRTSVSSTSSSSARQRQSRSRKKLSRRMSSNSVSNYFNKSFDDDDADNNFNNANNNQSNDNDEIHV